MTELVPVLVAVVVVCTLAHAAWSDLARRLIPNTASIVIAVVGLFERGLVGPAAAAVSVSLSFGLFCALVVIHARGILGGGDVKLIAATSVGLSPVGVLNLLTIMALAGGVLAVVHLALRHLPGPKPRPFRSGAISRVFRVERWRIRRRGPLPYGIAIATAGAWVFLTNLGS